MTGLESQLKPKFDIVKEQDVCAEGLIAVPLSLRKQMLDAFDNKFELKNEDSAPSIKFSLNGDGGAAEFLTNARVLFQEKEYDLAINLYEAVLKLDSRNEIALKGIAACCREMGQHEKAIDVLKTLCETNRSPEVFKWLGDELYALEYFADATGAYLQSLRLNLYEAEELFDVYKNLGNCFLKLGDDASAEENYNRAYTIHPDSDVLLVNFASLALYRGDFDKALHRFREAVQLNNSNHKAWTGLAMIHREYGDMELAWANIEKSLDIEPSNESAVKLVCEWALKDNEIDRAIRRIESYLQINDQDAQMILWLAKFQYFGGRLEMAKASAERALRIQPDITGGREVLRVAIEEITNREKILK